jgi:hypothetical protein
MVPKIGTVSAAATSSCLWDQGRANAIASISLSGTSVAGFFDLKSVHIHGVSTATFHPIVAVPTAPSKDRTVRVTAPTRSVRVGKEVRLLGVSAENRIFKVPK